MLSVTWDTVRVFLHVTAATIWVGGQLTLAGLVPAIRRLGPEVPRAVARQFNRIAWPAFGVLVVSGLWNVYAIQPRFDTAYGRTVIVKVVVVTLSGVSAAIHAGARARWALAVFGAAAGLTALAALFLGVQLG